MFYNAKKFEQGQISYWDVKKLSTYTNFFCNSGLSMDQKKKIEMEWVKKNSKISSLSGCVY